MGGSFQHIIDKDLNFIGVDLIDNLGDAHEALDECYDMIMHLTGGNKKAIWKAHLAHLAKRHPHHNPGHPDYEADAAIRTFEVYWDLPPNQKCKYIVAFAGLCGAPTENGEEFCENHKGVMCTKCKEKQATRECCGYGSFGLVCGYDLCDDCRHWHE